MGTLVPVAFQAIQALQAVGSVATAINGGIGVFDNRDERTSQLALQQLQQQQSLEQQRTAQKAILDKQEISAKAAEVEKQRRDALKRAVARQRVQFGASGVSSNGGSSEAVLLGLFDESDEQRQLRERLDNIRLQSIDQNLSNISRVNTLEKTQLAERNRLKNSSSTLDDVTDFLSIF